MRSKNTLDAPANQCELTNHEARLVCPPSCDSNGRAQGRQGYPRRLFCWPEGRTAQCATTQASTAPRNGSRCERPMSRRIRTAKRQAAAVGPATSIIASLASAVACRSTGRTCGPTARRAIAGRPPPPMEVSAIRPAPSPSSPAPRAAMVTAHLETPSTTGFYPRGVGGIESLLPWEVGNVVGIRA